MKSKNQQKPFPPHPHNRSSKMIIQLQSFPQPLCCPQPQPLLPFPQQHKIKRIQIIELQSPKHLPSPHPLFPVQESSHPHPQFVAAKSLIVNPPDFVHTSYYASAFASVTV